MLATLDPCATASLPAYVDLAPAPVGTHGPTRATYLRRRVAALLLLTVLVAVVAHAVQLVAAGPGGATAPASGDTAAVHVVHVVRPGDTLWSIARDVQPSGDLRPLVDGLAAQVGGEGALQVGQRLVLPAP